MKVIVTGATGFLGTELCAQLEAQGHHLTRLNSRNCDLTNAESLLAYNHSSYDRIYHLAAWTQAGDFCLFHPGEQWVINQQINTNVLAWWQKHQPQARLLCMSTSCTYAPDVALVEDNCLVGTPIESLFTYAMTKRMLYIGLLALQKQFGLDYLCFVPSTLYGPGYHTDGRQMHFIFDLIRKIMRGKWLGEPVVLWGDGYQKRELMFVRDFVRIMLSLSDKCQNDLINIGSGQEFTIRYFAQAICNIVGYDFNKIEFDETRYVGAKSKCLDIAKMNRLLPAFALTPLEEGLRDTVVWFENECKSLLKES